MICYGFLKYLLMLVIDEFWFEWTLGLADILQSRTEDKPDDFDVTTLSHQINQVLTSQGVEFPPGGGINSKYVLARCFSNHLKNNINVVLVK